MNNNSKDEIECIWKEKYPQILRYTQKVCRNTNLDPEDLVSSAFLKVWNYKKKRDDTKISLPFICLIIKQLFFNELKRASFRYMKNSVEIDDIPHELPKGQGDVFEQYVIQEELQKILHKLCNSIERKILLMRFMDGDSYFQISQLTGFSEAACRQRVRSIRKKIKISQNHMKNVY
ncbi:MAG: sigma-70 family RNA polymerase sigma factor [Alcanivoracaceae bacterium]|nr:sigma-70 family RNA polymerase sigma factor [Alcanivoracaceae bacterium]